MCRSHINRGFNKPTFRESAIMSNTQQDDAQQPNAQQPDAQQSDEPQSNAKQAGAHQSDAHQPNAEPSSTQQSTAQQSHIQRPKATQPKAKRANEQQSNAQRPDTQPRRDKARSRGPPQQRRSTKTSKLKSAMESARHFLSDVSSCIRIIPCCLLEGCVCLYDIYAGCMLLCCAGVIAFCNYGYYCLVLGGRDEWSGRFVAWELGKEMWGKFKGWRSRK